MRAGVDYLLALPEVKRVGALGHSLGAAAVVRAAATDERLQALVIQSSYSSLPQATADAFNSFSIFPQWPFAPLIITLAEYRLGIQMSQIDSARDLATMRPRPVLIIHGAGDTLFRPHHARKMYEAAQEPKTLWLVDSVGHRNPIEGHEVAYQERLLNFFEQSLAPR